MKKILKVALLISIIFCAAILIWTVIEYNIYVSTTIAKYEERGIPRDLITLWTYMDLYRDVVLGDFAFLIVSICIIAYLNSKKKAALTCFVILALTLIMQRNISRVEAEAQTTEETQTTALEEITVNGLMYFDEECTDEAYRKFRYEEFFIGYRTNLEPPGRIDYSPYLEFLNHWNIRLIGLNDWNTFWESDDGISDSHVLLQNAIAQAGGVWDTEQDCFIWKPKEYETTDGFYYIADLLVVFAGQGMDVRGLSFPEGNALIIQECGPSTEPYVELHEMSHQFRCTHCSNICVMNPSWAWIQWNWCERCIAVINNNREKWGYKQWLEINVEPLFPSGGCTTPIDCCAYQKVRGSSLTVEAFPHTGFAFDKWLLDGVAFYDNPISITMNQDHGLIAHFAIKSVILTVYVPQAPAEGVQVWIDGYTYRAYAKAPVSVNIQVGVQHKLEVQKSFLKEGLVPDSYYIYTFQAWSDSPDSSGWPIPRCRYITPTSDLTLTAAYVRSKYGIASQQPE